MMTANYDSYGGRRSFGADRCCGAAHAASACGNSFTYGHNLKRRYPAQYIRKGDRIYVRIIQDRVKVMDFTVENADSYTALIGEIRYAARELQGLAQIYIRNHSRGWSEERPMMFYRGMPAPRRGVRRNGPGYERVITPARQMLAPWQVH